MSTPTPTPTPAVAVQPVVNWPRSAAAGQRYLVTVDVVLAEPANWPYDREEFIVGCVLDGGDAFTVEALGSTNMVLHRFGGTYGPVRFAARAERDPADDGSDVLLLTLVTEGGLTLEPIELQVLPEDAGNKPTTQAYARWRIAASEVPSATRVTPPTTRVGAEPQKQRTAQRIALLIGAEFGRLESPRNDLWAMKSALDQHGFETVHVVAGDATRDRILAAYEEIIEEASPDDVVFVFFSGQASVATVPAASDGSDPRPYLVVPFLRPSDFNDVEGFGGITTIEIGALLTRLAQKTRNTVAVYDCGSTAVPVHPVAEPPDSTYLADVALLHHIAALRENRFPLFEVGNPHVVQLHACGPGENAFETNFDGRLMGVFTNALVAALTEAVELRVTWMTLIDHVSRRISALVTNQHPVVTGPARRLLFSTAEADQETSLAIVADGPNRAQLLGAALLGTQVGDEFAVMPAGSAGPDDATKLGDAVVDAVSFADAGARLSLRSVDAELPIGARAHRVKAMGLLTPVRVSPNAGLEELDAAISASSVLRTATDDDPFMLEVRGDDAGNVTITDRIGPLSDPLPTTVFQTIVTSLERLARAATLREVARDPRWGLSSSVAVEWGTMVDGRQYRLPLSGGLIHAGEHAYIQIVNNGTETVYVSLVDIGVAGTVTLLTDFSPGGLRLQEGEQYTFGEGIGGVEVTWPHNLDTSQARPETIIVLATSEPYDFGLLEQHGVRTPRAARNVTESSLTLLGARNPGPAPQGSSATIRYGSRPIDFDLDPRPAPSASSLSAEVADFARRMRNSSPAAYRNMSLPGLELPRNVPYESLYIEPDLVLEAPGTSVPDAIRQGRNTVIFGGPGAGKSFVLEKIARDLAADQLAGIEGAVPFLLKLRDFRQLGTGELSILDALEQICHDPHHVEVTRPVLARLLSSGGAVMLIDGLDELLEISARQRFIRHLENFMADFPRVTVLVTSRQAGYAEARLDPAVFAHGTIGAWDVDRIRRYVERWFELNGRSGDHEFAALFMAESESIAELRTNPLLLSLLCSLYVAERLIPRNRVDVFERCTRLLLGRWDTARGITSKSLRRYDEWIPGAASSLAWHMLNSDRPGDALPRREALRTLADYLASYIPMQDEATEAAHDLLAYLARRAWVLTEVGLKGDEPVFAFTHRVFLEYFAARHLAQSSANGEKLWSALRSHVLAGGWATVAQMALQLLTRVRENADELLLLAMAERPTDPQQEIHLKSFLAEVISDSTVSHQVRAEIERFLRESE